MEETVCPTFVIVLIEVCLLYILDDEWYTWLNKWHFLDKYLYSLLHGINISHLLNVSFPGIIISD